MRTISCLVVLPLGSTILMGCFGFSARGSMLYPWARPLHSKSILSCLSPSFFSPLYLFRSREASCAACRIVLSGFSLQYDWLCSLSVFYPVNCATFAESWATWNKRIQPEHYHIPLSSHKIPRTHIYTYLTAILILWTSLRALRCSLSHFSWVSWMCPNWKTATDFSTLAWFHTVKWVTEHLFSPSFV